MNRPGRSDLLNMPKTGSLAKSNTNQEEGVCLSCRAEGGGGAAAAFFFFFSIVPEFLAKRHTKCLDEPHTEDELDISKFGGGASLGRIPSK